MRTRSKYSLTHREVADAQGTSDMHAPDDLVDSFRFRCEPDLKIRLEKIAKRKHKNASIVVREVLWHFIEKEEAEETQSAIRLNEPKPKKPH